jgi:hypothetical protein
MVFLDISEKKGQELAEKLGADKDIVMAGTALMDVKLGQALSEGKIKEHVKMSSDAAKEFLEKYDLDEDTKKKIINCVEAHHGKVPFECKEAEICANADAYRFLHPRGFFYYFVLLGEREKDYNKILDQVEAKLEEKWNVLSLDICKEETEEYYKTFKQYLKEVREF